MMKDDVFIASLVQYGFLDQVYSRIKNELRYLPDMNELRMVVSAADSLSRHYIEMGSNPVTEEEALEFIEDCSKYPSCPHGSPVMFAPQLLQIYISSVIAS